MKGIEPAADKGIEPDADKGIEQGKGIEPDADKAIEVHLTIHNAAYICHHIDCFEEIWSVCMNCEAPLCGRHLGLWHKGNREHPEYFEESRCHEHQWINNGCSCKQCSRDGQQDGIEEVWKKRDEADDHKGAGFFGVLEKVKQASKIPDADDPKEAKLGTPEDLQMLIKLTTQIFDRERHSFGTIDIKRFATEDSVKNIVKDNRARRTKNCGQDRRTFDFQMYMRLGLRMTVG